MTDTQEKPTLSRTLRQQAQDLQNCDTLPRQHRDTQYEIDAAISVLEFAAHNIDRLTAQRNELREALEALLCVCPCENGCPQDDMSCATNRARTALNNTKD